MNNSFPFAMITMLAGILAAAGVPTTFFEVLEQYGFPVLVSIALWLRLERTQKEDRADRLASDAERLKALTDLKTSVEVGYKALKTVVETSKDEQHAINLKAVAATLEHASAVDALSERIGGIGCLVYRQTEMFREQEVVSLPPHHQHRLTNEPDAPSRSH